MLYIKSSEFILFITESSYPLTYDSPFLSPPSLKSYDNYIASLIPNLCTLPHHRAYTLNGINLYFSRRKNFSEILQACLTLIQYPIFQRKKYIACK